MSGRRSSCYLTKWKCVRQINSLKMFICTVTNSYSMDLNRNRTVKNKSIKKYASKTASKWNWSNRVVKTTNHSEHGNKLDHSKWFFLVFAYVYPFFVIFGSVFSYLVTLFFPGVCQFLMVHSFSVFESPESRRCNLIFYKKKTYNIEFRKLNISGISRYPFKQRNAAQ